MLKTSLKLENLMVGFLLEKVQRCKKAVNEDLSYIRVKKKQNP